MDGVIFKDVNFWMELHKKFGTLEEGIQLTEKYLLTDYPKLVEEVVSRLWKGKDAKHYFDLINSLEYLPGVKKTFDFIHQNGLVSAIISASSLDAVRRVQREHGVDHVYGNELVIRNGLVSGDFIWPIGAGRDKKAKIVKDLCSELNIPLNQAVYVGDSDTDVEAAKEVGLSLAFNCTPKVKELTKVASYVINSNDLSEIIPYLSK